MVDEQELLMREVDEDIRRDKFDDAWRKYRVYIIGTAVSIVLVVASNTFWKSYVTSTRDAASDAYVTSLTSAAAEGADVSAVWNENRASLSGGYVGLSYLQEAAVLLKAGKAEEALNVYATLSSDTTAENRLRELAQLLAGRIEYDLGKYAEARGRFITLAGDDGIWSFSAQESLALIDIAEGNIADAVEKLKALAANPATPEAIHERAEELRQLFETELEDTVATATDETQDTAVSQEPQESEK